jgi:hypothetical protein
MERKTLLCALEMTTAGKKRILRIWLDVLTWSCEAQA